ncbi:universal stress protein [Pseudonocardia acaciae]|uniref:universal stress protein n=1 Tax=Pseudonocardia acaciae TaxID=551276 RepID=UPI00055D5CAC|nr:universal stress protein [Pseudonocardia acaciae]
MSSRAGRPIVVGVDGSRTALDAVRWAAEEARRRGLAVRLVCAFAWADALPLEAELAARDYRTMLMATLRARVNEAAAAVAELAPEIRVEKEVVAGYPVQALRAESERAALLVLGGRGAGGVLGLLVGSVATAMAGHAACPVVVVREPADSSAILPVVVGVDGSPHSEAAVAFGYEAASLRGVPLVAAHTWSDLLFDPQVAPMMDWDTIVTREREVLAERLAGWAEKFPDVEVRRVVVRDRPAHTLLEQAAHAQLLVVGSRGRGQLAGLVLGSVSHAVLHNAPCPVAVVRATDLPAPKDPS